MEEIAKEQEELGIDDGQGALYGLSGAVPVRVSRNSHEKDTVEKKVRTVWLFPERMGSLEINGQDVEGQRSGVKKVGDVYLPYVY